MRRTVISVPALIALFALAGCGDDGDGSSEARGDEPSSSTTTSSTTTTTSSTTTTVPVTGSPPTIASAGPTETCKTPDEAAASLHDAWATGDHAAASRCATPDAVNALFAGSAGPAAGEYFAGCFGQESPVTCSYAYTGGGISFTIERAASLGTGCQVTGVAFVAD